VLSNPTIGAVKQLSFSGKTFTDDVKESTNPSRPLEIGMGHDPKLAGKLRQRVGTRADKSGVAIAEVAGK
jgi:hypothetical protein